MQQSHTLWQATSKRDGNRGIVKRVVLAFGRIALHFLLWDRRLFAVRQRRIDTLYETIRILDRTGPASNILESPA
jgi:hypothetical protein